MNPQSGGTSPAVSRTTRVEAAGGASLVALAAALALLAGLTLIETLAILALNDGQFGFTLDEGYVRLALAENILRGTYGINAGEFGAPSASLLWPFLLAPFAAWAGSPWLVLALNLAAAAGTLYLSWRILGPRADDPAARAACPGALQFAALCALLLATNLVGLVFTGMEHSLQQLAAAAIVCGLVHEVSQRECRGWLVAAIIAAPLIRYECLALSLPAIVFLYLRGHRRAAIVAAASILIALGSFSLLLLDEGFLAVPNPLFVKSPVIAGGFAPGALATNFRLNIVSGNGVLLATGALFLCFAACDRRRDAGARLFAGVLVTAILLHLVCGRSGGYHRYDICILTAALLALAFVYGPNLHRYAALDRFSALTTAALLLAAAPLLFPRHVIDLATIPLAANNIHEQHGQMHRFATQFHRGPVAVNDFGRVSWRNDRSVLELRGLASIETLRWRYAHTSHDWMDDMARARGIPLAMINEQSFYRIPSGWRKLGAMELSRRRVTPAYASVSFYSLERSADSAILEAMSAFCGTLPRGVRLRFEPGVSEADPACPSPGRSP